MNGRQENRAVAEKPSDAAANFDVQELASSVTFMLRLHYVPGDHGNHVLGHRGQNGMDVR